MQKLLPTITRVMAAAEESRQRLAAERALRESEEKFRTLVDSMDDIVYTLDLEGRYTGIFGKWIAKYGLLPACFIGKKFPKILSAEAADIHENANTRALAGESIVYEWSTEKHKELIYFQTSLSPLYDDKGRISGIVGVVRDITDHRKSQEILQDNEAKFRQLFETESDARFLVDKESGIILEVNNSAVQMYGFTREELLRMHNTDLSSEPEKTVEATECELTTIPIRWHRNKNGDVFPVEITASHFLFHGKRVHLAAIRDISKKLEVEKKLQKSEERFRRLAENAVDLIYRYEFSPKRGFTYVSPAALAITGYTPEEHYADPDLGFKLVHPNDRSILEQYHRNGGQFHEPIVLRWVRKDGRTIWTEQRNVPIFDKTGKLEAIEGIARDVTERKHAEEALQESLERFQMSNRATFNVIWDWNLQTDAIWWNDNFRTIFGYETEEIEQSIESWTNRIHPDDIERVKRGIHAAIDSGGQSWSDQYRFRKKDGCYAVVVDRGFISRDFEGKPIRMIGAMEDITEQKLAEQSVLGAKEEAVQIAEQWQTTFDATNDAMWIIDQDNTILRANSISDKLFHLPSGRLVGSRCYEIMHGTSTPIPECPILRVRNTLRREAIELQMGEKWYNIIVDPIKDASGRYSGAVHILSDITKRKKMEEALRESEQRFRSLYENATIGIYRTTPDGHILMANPALFKMLGYETFEDLERRNLESDGIYSVPPRSEFRRSIEAKGEVIGLESSWKRADGMIIYVRENARLIRDGNGDPLYYDGTVEDVTEQKLTQVALIKERSLMRSLLDNIPDHIYFKDKKSRFIMISKSQANRFGLQDPGQAVSKTDFDFFTEEHARAAFENEQKIIRDGLSIVGIEEKETWPDGSETWVSTTKVPMRDENGSIIGTFGISRDITKHRKAEEERNRWVEAFTNADWGIVIADSKKPGRIEILNPAFARMHGYAMEELTGRPIIELFAPGSRKDLSANFDMAIKKGHHAYESVHITRDGTHFPVQIGITIMKNTAGAPVSAVVHIQDITERKKMENRIMADLKEKETLLREIHHRVKNNLQVISSLLNLQIDRLNDPLILAVFRESQDRILSMAMVHEALYQSESLSEIDFAEYLESFVRRLFSSYCADTEKIELCIDAESAKIEIDQAVPCGLIVHELVSNALKHAFPAGRKKKGRLEILFRNVENNLLLTVRDDGVGLPESFSFLKSESLGMRLVSILVEQLEGKIELRRKRGTEFNIRFPAVRTSIRNISKETEI